MPKTIAVLGSALFFVVAPLVLAGFVPWWITHWEFRPAFFGFELARERRKKLTSVDKANVMSTSRLWREIATELSTHYKEVAFESQLVDSMAMSVSASDFPAGTTSLPLLSFSGPRKAAKLPFMISAFTESTFLRPASLSACP